MNTNYADEFYAKEAFWIAEAVLIGSTSIVDGCPRLSNALRKNFAIDHPAFAVIAEVCAKVREFPMPEDRHLWNHDVVKVKDEELAAWLPSVRNRVIDACREIIRRFDDAV